MGFTSAIPCADPNCPLCHGKGKYYRLDFSHIPEIPFRPQSLLEIAPLEIKELACLRPAFDQVLDTILDELFRFPSYPHCTQGPPEFWSGEEIRISRELRRFLDERR
jgi:hypothetical protein